MNATLWLEIDQVVQVMPPQEKLHWDRPEILMWWGRASAIVHEINGPADSVPWDFAMNDLRTGRASTNAVARLTTMLHQTHNKARMASGKASSKPSPLAKIGNKVFIVHGHDDFAREAVARYLGSLGLEPIILHEQASRSRTIIEKIEANSDVGFAVVLLTPDDEGCVKGGTLEPRARQNVLLELGYFFARLGRDRVCALMRGKVSMPSDFAGVVWVEMDGANGWKLALGKELKAAGYAIDLNRAA